MKFRALIAGLVLAAAMATPTAAQTLTIAVVGKGIGGEYWVAVRDGAQKAAARLHVKFVYQGPPTETDVSGQITIMENLISRKVDGIAISPVDAKSLGPVVKKAVSSGIKVVTIDSDTLAKDRLCYIGTDNTRAGAIAGASALKILHQKGKVAIVTGVLGAQNLQQRVQGFKKAVAGRLTILPEQPDNGDKARAVEVAENTLTAHPEVAAFFTDNAIAGPGVGQALKAHHLVGKVHLVAMDVTPDLLKLLKEGVADVLIAQKPQKMGQLAVENLVKAIGGHPIPRVIDTGVEVVTRKH